MWFRVSAEARDASMVLSCAGELDATTVERIAEAAGMCLDRGVAMIVVDCREVTFIDSSGVQALVTIVQRCRESGTGFTLLPSDRVHAVAETLERAEILGLPASERRVPLEGLETPARR